MGNAKKEWQGGRGHGERRRISFRRAGRKGALGVTKKIYEMGKATGSRRFTRAYQKLRARVYEAAGFAAWY